jgi:hypothetical protein
MFSLHAARHPHSFTLLRRSLISSRTPAIRHASLDTLARPQSIVRHCQPAVQRHASSQNVAKTAAVSRMLTSSMFKTSSVACEASAYNNSATILSGPSQCLPRKCHPDRLCRHDANRHHRCLRPRSLHYCSSNVLRPRSVHVVGACCHGWKCSPACLDRSTLCALRFDRPSTPPTEC